MVQINICSKMQHVIMTRKKLLRFYVCINREMQNIPFCEKGKANKKYIIKFSNCFTVTTIKNIMSQMLLVFKERSILPDICKNTQLPHLFSEYKTKANW